MCIEKTRGCRADDRVPLGICASSDQSRRAKGPTVRVGNPVDWNLPRIRTRKPSMNLKVSPTAAWEYVCPSRAWPVAVLSGFLQGFLLVHRSTFPRFGLPRFLPSHCPRLTAFRCRSGSSGISQSLSSSSLLRRSVCTIVFPWGLLSAKRRAAGAVDGRVGALWRWSRLWTLDYPA